MVFKKLNIFNIYNLMNLAIRINCEATTMMKVINL